MDEFRVAEFWLDRTPDGRLWSIRAREASGREVRLLFPKSALPGVRRAIDSLHLRVFEAPAKRKPDPRAH